MSEKELEKIERKRLMSYTKSELVEELIATYKQMAKLQDTAPQPPKEPTT